jgi:hypothetical protein
LGKRNLKERKSIGAKYDSRGSRLTHVWGKLLYKGRLEEQQLCGLSQHKLDAIGSYEDFLAEVETRKFGTLSVMAFHEKAGRSQVESSPISIPKQGFPSPSRHCCHPSVRTLDERSALGASWVFSFQPVLPLVRRPLFQTRLEVGQAIDAVTGTRLWAFAVSRITMLLSSFACCCAVAAAVFRPLAGSWYLALSCRAYSPLWLCRSELSADHDLERKFE